MYFTIHTNLETNLSQIVSHHKSLYLAKESLLESAKRHVHDLYGRVISDHIQTIIYPQTLDKNMSLYVSEHGQAEIVILISELDVQKLYVYKKHIITDQGWIYNSTKFTYQVLSIFQIVDYNIESTDIEYVQHGSVSIPKVMTIAPMAEVMQDLINCKRFLAQKSKYD